MSRTARSLRGLVADQGANIVSMLLVFVATPILLRHLGETDYGFWMTVMQLLGYIGLVDPGLGLQVTRSIAGANDDRLLQRFLATAFYSQLGFAVLFLGVGWGIGPLLNRVIDLPPGGLSTYGTSYFLAVSVGACGVVTGYFVAILAGRQRLVASSLIGSIQQTLGLAAGTLVVSLGAGLLALPLSYLIAALGALGVAYLLARRHEPRLDFRLGLVSRSEFSSLAGFSGYFQMAKVAFVVLMNTPSLVIAAELGPAAVAVYVVTARLALTSGGLIARAASSAFPGVSELVAQNDLAALRRVVVNIQFLAARIGLLMALVILVVNETFINLWVGPSLYGGMILTLSVCGMVVRDAIVRTVGVVIFAEGNMRWLGWLSLVEAVMTVVLTIAFTRRLGLAGAALGPLVATTLVISPYSFWRVAQIIGMPASALLWRGAGRAFLRTIPAFGALLIVAECLPKSLGWLWILIVGLAAVAANIAMFDLPILLRTQRQEWSQRFHALFEAH